MSQAHLISTIVEEEVSLGAMMMLASLHGGKVAVAEGGAEPALAALIGGPAAPARG